MLRDPGGWGWSCLGAKYDHHNVPNAEVFTRRANDVQQAQRTLLGCDNYMPQVALEKMAKATL